jgi:hypothetical protein
LGVQLLDKIPLQSQVSNQDVEIQTLDSHLSHHAEAAVTDYFLTPGGLSKQKVKTTTHASEVASSK